ncbi:SpoIIE family protein phosphatase [Geomonas limicola]|nr:SpoIIE family protein phosphatase [Geomonas limicola]
MSLPAALPEASPQALPSPGTGRPAGKLIESTPETRALTLLIAEDDPVSRGLLSFCTQELFKEVLLADNGLQALTLFRERQPDMVLTDQVMPGLTGLELMEAIRADGDRTPVILMTTVHDRVLLQAINQGVDRFVPKPFDLAHLVRTLSTVAAEVVNRRVVERHREQEVELLRYRDTYNALQQESARRKERHVVRHDLLHQVIPGSSARWAINVAFTPRDIMCGDGYSVRQLFDGRQLVFLVDAMGSGMSASLTAMLTTSFFNYQVDHLHRWRNFDLATLLERFQEYLSSVLFEEEVLSCGFLLIDLKREELEAALFALPPLLLRRVDGSIEKIPGRNPPLASYSTPFRVNRVSLKDAANLLIITDGVTDAPLKEGGIYREVLEEDFLSTPTLSGLKKRFLTRIEPGNLDDLTVLHLRRLDLPSQWTWSGRPELNLAGQGRLIEAFLAALAREIRVPQQQLDEVELILSEALTNAFEHGCLGLERDEKQRLVESGDFEALLSELPLPPGARISLKATLWRGAQQPLLLIEVLDSGPGIPAAALYAGCAQKSLSGRGLAMIGRLCDSLFTGGPGGHLFILKTLDQGESDAD